MKKTDKKVSNFNPNTFRVNQVNNGYEVQWYQRSWLDCYGHEQTYVFSTKEDLVSWLNTNVDEIKE